MALLTGRDCHRGVSTRERASRRNRQWPIFAALIVLAALPVMGATLMIASPAAQRPHSWAVQ